MLYCQGCGLFIADGDAVNWLNPRTGDATSGDGGRPYHSSCSDGVYQGY